MAGGGNRTPLDHRELERWTRVGYEASDEGWSGDERVPIWELPCRYPLRVYRPPSEAESTNNWKNAGVSGSGGLPGW